ncbi:MAG: hypothetical protein AAF549_00355 [Pseudomonadota bacterium]
MTEINEEFGKQNNSSSEDKKPLPDCETMWDWAAYLSAIVLCDMADHILDGSKVVTGECSYTKEGHVGTLVFNSIEDRDKVFEALHNIPEDLYEDIFVGSARISHQDHEIQMIFSSLYDFANLASAAVDYSGDVVKITPPLKSYDEVTPELMSYIPAHIPSVSKEAFTNTVNSVLEGGTMHQFGGFSVKPWEVISIVNGCYRAEDKTICPLISAHIT